jgi:hypothetical protein
MATSFPGDKPMSDLEAACLADDGHVIGPDDLTAAQPSPPVSGFGGDGHQREAQRPQNIRAGVFARGAAYRAIAIVSLLVALASPSYAIDFSVIITDLKNEPLTERSADGRVIPITLGQLCSNALLATYEDERSLPAQEKIRRFKLAMKLNDANGNPAKDVSLTTAEIAEISKLSAKLYSPLAVGKILQIIDPGALK